MNIVDLEKKIYNYQMIYDVFGDKNTLDKINTFRQMLRDIKIRKLLNKDV